MKAFAALALGLVAGLSAPALVDAGVQYDRRSDRRADQVCVYKDINYFGAEQCYRGGEEIANLGAQSKSISSIRVYGRATVTVYEKSEFGGHSAQFTSDVPDLGKRMMEGNTGWSDRIISLRTAGASYADDRTNSGILRSNQSQQPRDGVCVYDRPNYEGRSQCWNQGESVTDLSRQGDWNGQISSIRLFGGRTVTVVYQDIGYRGESLTVDRDIPDLAIQEIVRRNGNGNGRGRGNNGKSFGTWDRQISSLQVQMQRRDR